MSRGESISYNGIIIRLSLEKFALRKIENTYNTRIILLKLYYLLQMYLRSIFENYKKKITFCFEDIIILKDIIYCYLQERIGLSRN